MKHRAPLLAFAASVLGFLALAAAPLSAQATLYWDADGTGVASGGSGTWDTSNALWTTAAPPINATNTYFEWGNGTNVAVFAGALNTVTLGTHITAGHVVFVGGATVFNLNGFNLTLGGDNTDSSMLASSFMGSGKFIKTGTGTITLSSDTGHTGGIDILGGTLVISADHSLGAFGAPLTLAGGTLKFSSSFDLAGNRPVTVTGTGTVETNFTATIPAGISGTGTFVKTGTGTLTLSGTNTYQGGTTISAGTLQIGTGGTSGSVIGNITNNSALIFNRSNALAHAGIISGSGTLTKSGAGTLTLTGNNTYTGGTTLSGGTLALGSAGALGSSGQILFYGGTLQFSAANATNYSTRYSNAAGQAYSFDTGGQIITLSGPLNSAGGSLTKSGAGTLQLAASGTVIGDALPVTVHAGTLQLGLANETIGSLAGTGGIVDVGLQTLTAGGTNASTSFAGIIQGAGGSFVKTGTGTQILTGASTYTGTTTISGGTLQIGNGGSLTSSSITNNAALVFNHSDASAYAGPISGSGSLAHAGTGTLTLTGNVTSTGGVTISSGTLQLGNGGSTGSLTGDVTNHGTLTFNRNDLPTFSGNVSGTGSLMISGSGTLTLSGDNTFTGGLTVGAGTLRVSADSALGTSAGAVTLAGGTLQFGAAFDLTSTRPVVVTGTGTIDTGTFNSILASVISGAGGLTKAGAGTLTLSGTNTYSGATTISGGTLQIGGGGTTGSLATSGITNHASLVFNRSDDISYAGVISGSGTLTKLGAGTLTLSGTNTFTTGFSINAGTVQLGNSGSVLADTLPVVINNTATLKLGTASEAIGTLGGNGGTLDLGASTLTVGSTNSNVFPGVIQGTGSLIKVGTGTQILTGANTYSGATTISGGTLQIGNGGTTGSVATSDITNHATLAFYRSDATSYGGVISGSGSVTKTGAGTLTLSGTNTFTGGLTITTGTVQLGDAGSVLADTLPVVVNNAAILRLGAAPETVGSLAGNGFIDLAGSALTIGGANSPTTFSGVIQGTGSLIKVGSGTQTLAGANTYTGTTTLSGGTLALGASHVLPDTTALTINSGATLNLASFSDTIGSLTGSGNVTLGSGVLAIGANNTNTDFSGVVSGTGSLVKLGTGTQTLSGANTYTGTTTISAGTLSLGAASVLPDTTRLTVDSGATFNLASFSDTIGTLAGSGNVTLGSGTLTLAPNDTGALFSGVVSGTGNLVKSGNGIQTLSGANTYTGSTTISSGEFVIGAANALPDTTAVTIDSGAGLTVNFSDTIGSLAGSGPSWLVGTLTVGANNLSTGFSGRLLGSGSFAKIGTGTLTLSGANTYTGATTLSGGTLALGASNVLPDTTALTINSGATLNLASFSDTIGSLTGPGNVTLGSGVLTIGANNTNTDFSGVVSGTGSLVKVGTGTLKLSGTNTHTGGTTLSVGTLALDSAGALGSTGPISFTGGTLQFSALNTTDYSPRFSTAPNQSFKFDTGGQNVTLASALASLGGTLNKTGTGTLTLAGANTYNGTTTISAGTLVQGSASALSSGNILIASGAALDTSTFDVPWARVSGAGTVVSSSGVFSDTANTDATSVANLAGPASLVKTGTGTLTLSGLHTYTGATTVSAGTLRFTNPSSFSATIASGLVVNSGATVAFYAPNFSSSAIASAAALGSVTGGFQSGSFLGLDTGPGTFDQNIALSNPNALGLVKLGSGTLRLTGNHTYTGHTLVTAGTFQIGDGTTTGAVAGNIALSAGTGLVFNRPLSASAVHFGGISGAGSVTKLGIDTLTLAGANTYTGTTTISAGTLVQGHASALASGNIVIALGATLDTSAFGVPWTRVSGSGTVVSSGGVFSYDSSTSASSVANLAGSASLVKAGTGTLSLSGLHTYTGATTVSAGTLLFVNPASFSASVSSGLVVNPGATLAFNAPFYGASAIATAAALGSATGGFLSGSFIGLDSGSSTFDQTIALANPNGGANSLGLVKLGTGTLRLTANNTYTGDTLVTAGTLQLGNGGLTGSVAGNIALSAGTNLVFNRQISASVVVHSGGISGAGSVTKLGTDTLKLSGTNTYTGPTTVTTGTLQFNRTASLYNSDSSAWTAANLTVNTGARAAFSVGGAGEFTTSDITLLAAVGTASGGFKSGSTLALDASTASGPFTFGGLIANPNGGANTLGLSILGTGTVVVTGNALHTGGTSILNGSTLQIGNGGTTGFVTGTIANGGNLIFNRSDDYLQTGAISGSSGTLTKLGAGTLTFTGANSYAGLTTIAAGTLQIGSGGATGAWAGAIFNNATLAFNRSGTITHTGAISGPGTVTKLGSGTLILSGLPGPNGTTIAHTYTGPTIVSAGTLLLDAPNRSSGYTVEAGAVLEIGYRFNSTASATTFAGTGTLRPGQGEVTSNSTATIYSLGAGSLIDVPAGRIFYGGDVNDDWSNNLSGVNFSPSTYGGFTINGANVRVDAINGLGNFNISGTLTFGVNNGSGVFIGHFESGSSGPGNIVKAGTGTQVLTNSHNHGGTTTVAGGTLQFGTVQSLNFGDLSRWTPSLFIVEAGATAAFNVTNGFSYQFTPAYLDSLKALGTATGGFKSGSFLGLDTSTADGGVFSYGSAIANPNAGANVLGLTKLGTGTLALSGVNTYTGTTTIAAGTLQLSGGAALADANPVVLANVAGVTLALTSSETIGSLAGGGTAGGVVSLGAHALTLGGNGQSTAFAGTLTGTGSLIKTGAGTLTLSGTNTFAGGVTLSGGTLAVAADANLGAPDGVLTVNGSTLATSADFSASRPVVLGAGGGTFALTGGTGAGSLLALTGPITGAGSLTQSGGTLVLTGDNTYSGGTVLTAGTLQLGHVNALGTGAISLATGTQLDVGATTFDYTRVSGSGLVTSSVSHTFAASASSTVATTLAGTGSLAKTGTGTLTLSGANLYSGGSTLATGTLAVGSDTALGTGPVTLAGGTLQATGGARTLANALTLDADTTLAGSTALAFTGPLTLARNRDLTVANTAITTLSGSIGQSGGARGLNKYGAGLLHLTGANTYTGGTLIGEGTVRINNATGSVFGTGAVTVAAGATLTGAGSFTGALQLNGTFSPGNSPGTTATGSQTWAGGAGYIWEFNHATGIIGTNTDLLSITGNLNITATSASRFTIALTSLLPNDSPGAVINFNSAQNYSYTVATASAGITGFSADVFTLNTSGFANATHGGTWSLAQSGNNLNLNFTAAAIPEPSTYAAIVGALALALAVYRRRR